MALLPIRLYGDPVLRTRATELGAADVTPALRQFVADMGETMYAASGIGLAANQVGDLRRLFVADVAQVDEKSKKGRRTKDATRRELLAYLNPEIVEFSPEDESYQEGCLSIPEIEADVFRPIRIRVRYRTLDWELRETWFDGLMARVFQHEMDHLDGVLFIDHLPEATRRRLAGPLSRIKRPGEQQAVSSAQTTTA